MAVVTDISFFRNAPAEDVFDIARYSRYLSLTCFSLRGSFHRA
jgi:hypothetical protein